MTDPFDEQHGDRLRRAMHAEADTVTPAADGLDRIHAKINKRRRRFFGLSFTAPWLRPLTAVAAAVVVAAVAFSATPAIKGFVSAGNQGSTARHENRSATADGAAAGTQPARPAPHPDPAPSHRAKATADPTPDRRNTRMGCASERASATATPSTGFGTDDTSTAPPRSSCGPTTRPTTPSTSPSPDPTGSTSPTTVPTTRPVPQDSP